MWKIFKCKRGEERGFIPGECSDSGIALSSGKGIEVIINKIKECVNSKIRVRENEKKIVVQNQRKFMGIIPFYKKFLEVYKTQTYRSFPAFRDGDCPEFRIKTYECEPTEGVVKVFDALERYS